MDTKDEQEGSLSVLEKSDNALEENSACGASAESKSKDDSKDKQDDSSGVLAEADDNTSTANVSRASDSAVKKTKHNKKSRHGKKSYLVPKDSTDRGPLRRVHHLGTKFKCGRRRLQTYPTISKFFLPHIRPRKEAFIPPTKFLLGGNISDPLNLNSLQDEDINRAMNAVTPKSSPLPTPPRHKAKVDVIIPPNIRDPLNLMEPLDNAEYEKLLEMQRKKPRKKTKTRRRTSECVVAPAKSPLPPETEGIVVAPTEPTTSAPRTQKRSSSESEGAPQKKVRRMDSLDKIVSPVVPQPGAWMRARAPPRSVPPERPVRPVSPSRIKQQGQEGEVKLPTFHPKNSKYQYGNYDRYYGYRYLNAMMDVRLQVFEMHKHLFQNKDVLDIGCNVGHISIACANALGARSVVGVDIDPSLIARARRNLSSFVAIPMQGESDSKVEKEEEETHLEKSDEKKPDCTKCTSMRKCSECIELQQGEKDEPKKPFGRKIKKPRKNRKAGKGVGGENQQCFFPMSLSLLYGPLEAPRSQTEITPPAFPHNIVFKQGNYVPGEDVPIGGVAEGAQFDLILCLSITKWLHLNWGDAGLKRAFRRMFADLRPGGKLVLEAQNWASYKKKKRLTPTIYENFNSIELFPNKFREYLLSPEVGFSKCAVLGVPQHASKGFRRPIQLYIKGDFTPSKACWSDAYAPSSHHRQETTEVRRTVYAPAPDAPKYRPSDETPSCGAATPYSPNLDCCADDSPFYNPRSDSYAPSYAPPRPTVYATLPSPVPMAGGASPASPAPGPASPAEPVPDAAEPAAARLYPEPAPPIYSPRAHEDLM